MSRLDYRAWLAWGAVASLPLLAGRHPLVIAELLAIALVVRSVCLPPSRMMTWGWLARLSALAVPIGIVFNVATVHAGDRVIVTLPDRIPIAGGELTWNAAIYGAMSGLAIVGLVLIGTTVAAGIAWSDLMRMLPARAAGLAVAGSVAWAFLPRLAQSWREIREAQTARGHRWSGPRDAVPLVVPLLAGGLDRAVVMAEALESRGFGAATARPTSRATSLIGAAAIVAATTGLYLFAVGRGVEALALIVLAGFAFASLAMTRHNDAVPHITRYRTRRWTSTDTIVTVGAAVAFLSAGSALQLAPELLQWNPYPVLAWPAGSIWLPLGLAVLLLPAVVAPMTGEAA